MTKSIVIIASVFLCISCNKNTDDIGSVVEVKGIVIHITDPKKNSRNIEDSLLQIKVDATDPQKKISKISLYIDHKLIASVNKSPYQYIWATSPSSNGNHEIRAIAYDGNDSILGNDSLEFIIYDNRLPYLGNFSFTIHKTSYGGVTPAVDTTFYDDGEIRNFSTGDAANDFFQGIPDSVIYSNRKISIQFWDNWLITTAISESGAFIIKSGKPHKDQSGKFSDINNVEFFYQSGGLGGGNTYKVSGKRK